LPLPAASPISGRSFRIPIPAHSNTVSTRPFAPETTPAASAVRFRQRVIRMSVVHHYRNGCPQSTRSNLPGTDASFADPSAIALLYTHAPGTLPPPPECCIHLAPSAPRIPRFPFRRHQIEACPPCSDLPLSRVQVTAPPIHTSAPPTFLSVNSASFAPYHPSTFVTTARAHPCHILQKHPAWLPKYSSIVLVIIEMVASQVRKNCHVKRHAVRRALGASACDETSITASVAPCPSGLN